MIGKVLKSDRRENYKLKFICGILGGILTGGILYFLLIFSFGFGYKTGGWVTLAVTLVLCAGLATSVHFRCIIVLMIPTLFTGRGRVAYLSIIFTLMLSGPVHNIADNAEQVSRSTACITELVQNQSLALKKQLYEPIRQIKTELKNAFDTAKLFADEVLKPLRRVTERLNSITDTVNVAYEKLKEAGKKCKDGVRKARDNCKKELTGSFDKCRSGLKRITDTVTDGVTDATDTVVDGVTDVADSIGSAFGRRRRESHFYPMELDEVKIKYRTAIDEALIKTFHVFGFSHGTFSSLPLVLTEIYDNQRNLTFYMDKEIQKITREWPRNMSKQTADSQGSTFNSYPPGDEHIRKKRMGFGDICNVLKIDRVCNILRAGEAVCDIPGNVGQLGRSALEATKNAIKAVEDFFYFEVIFKFDAEANNTLGEEASAVYSRVARDFQEKKALVMTITDTAAKFMALSLLLVFFRCTFYLRSYLSKDYYDNMYITKEFKKFDELCKEQGKHWVLPLKRREKTKYIDTTSIKMSLKELKMCKEGVMAVLLHFLLTALVIVGDYVLYYLLELQNKYGKQAVSVAGIGTVDIGVTGSGPISKFLRYIVDGLNLDFSYEADFNITECLPSPSKPDDSNILLFSFLYVVGFFFIFLQAYGLRVRRKIVSYFYPEQETDRICFLHNKIRHKRAHLLPWLRRHLASKKKGFAVSKRMRLWSILTYPCPNLGMPCFKPKMGCFCCGVEDDGSIKFYFCPTFQCTAVYCTNCFGEMNNTCLLCDKKSNAI